MNNSDLINDALSLIGVLPEGTTATASQAELGLREINALVEEWADDGVIVNWSPQAELAEITSLMGLELQSVKYHLAIRLCPHFGREPAPSVVALAQSAFNKLLRVNMVKTMEPITLVVPLSEGGTGVWDFRTDEIV
jgi:hypothetical protein